MFSVNKRDAPSRITMCVSMDGVRGHYAMSLREVKMVSSEI